MLASFEAVIDADRAINDAADSHGDGGAAAGGDNALVGCGGAGSWVRGVGTIDKPIFLVGLRAPQGADQPLVLGAVGGAEAPARSPHPTPATGVSAEMLTTLPVLTGQDFEFSQTEIRVRVGNYFFGIQCNVTPAEWPVPFHLKVVRSIRRTGSCTIVSDPLRFRLCRGGVTVADAERMTIHERCY